MDATKVRAPARTDDAKGRHQRHSGAWFYFCVTALGIPLAYSTATMDPVLPLGFVVVAWLGIVLVAAFGARIWRSSTTLPVYRGEAIVIGCLVAYILVAALSALVAGLTPDAIFELLKLATFAWLIFASARTIDGQRSRLALLARFVVVSVFLVGGFAILQYYQVAIFEWMKRDTTVDSTMGHRNLLASFLVLAFPFVAYAFLELGGRWRAASAVSLFISIFLLVVLQTRAEWVGFPAGLVFGLVVLAIVVKRGRPVAPERAYRRRAIQGAVSTALALSVALLFPYAPQSRAPMREQVGSIVQLRNASIHERLQLWSRTIRMIRDHPLTGVGPGNWRVVIPAYGTAGMRSDTGTLHFQRPHNDFLWVASETGVPGGLLYLALFASVLGLAVSGMVQASSMHDRVVFALLSMGVSWYVLDSLFSFPRERISHTVYLALLIGAVLSFHREAGGRRVAWTFSRRWALVIVALAWVTTLTAGGYAWARFRAEVHLRRALEARAAKNWPLMVANLDRIDRRFYDMDPDAAPVAWYRGVAHYEMGDTTSAWVDFQSALAVHPNHVHVLNNIATCQVLRGEYEDAVRNYERAIEIAPRFEEARVNLGFVLHSLGRDREAYDVLAPGIEYATSPRFKECLGEVRSALGLPE